MLNVYFPSWTSWVRIPSPASPNFKLAASPNFKLAVSPNIKLAAANFILCTRTLGCSEFFSLAPSEANQNCGRLLSGEVLSTFPLPGRAVRRFFIFLCIADGPVLHNNLRIGYVGTIGVFKACGLRHSEFFSSEPNCGRSYMMLTLMKRIIGLSISSSDQGKKVVVFITMHREKLGKSVHWILKRLQGR